MIPLMKSAFINEYATKVALTDFILHATHLSMGTKCEEFERAFSAYQNRQFSVLFNSGGSANLALLQALKNLGKLQPGDHVGFSALTWSTNTMPIIQMGFIPVPVDCEIRTLNMMSGNLKERINEKSLKALFLTNVLGFAGDLEEIRTLCLANNILLLEDNCESLGSSVAGIKTGNFGSAATFSFFVAHHMSTIEGGMICTNDEELADMLKLVRANGWDRNLNAEKQFQLRQKFGILSEFEAKYTFYDLGFNLRPTEITGFLGLYQLQFLKENIAIREANFLKLEKIACRNNDLLTLSHQHISSLSPFAFPVLCKTASLRDKYLSRFSGAGIEIRPMIAGNMQNQPFYKKYVKHKYALPGTDFLDQCSFYCGNYPELTDSDLEQISSCLYQY